MSRAFALVATVCAPALTIAAQQPLRQMALGTPTLRFAEPFSDVAAVAELATGQVLVADRKERVLYLVSASGGSMDQLGRNGQGPNEYQGANGLVRIPGDTIWMYAVGSRYVRITPQGRIAGTVPIPTLLLSRGGLGPPRGADRSGRLYWAGDVIAMLASGPKRSLSQNVRRWVPGTERLDTVAVVADHAAAMHAHRFFPFAEHDAWVVDPEGRIGVLSAADYRLRWYRESALLSEGPRLEFTPIPVTAAERDAYRRERALSPQGAMSGPRPRAGSPPSDAVVRQMAEAYPDASFPASKPPFVEDGALRSPGGDIWVTRSMPTGATQTRFDVLDGTGARRGELTLNGRFRLVGLERGGVYLVRTDDDGLQWLERYAWPGGLR